MDAFSHDLSPDLLIWEMGMYHYFIRLLRGFNVMIHSIHHVAPESALRKRHTLLTATTTTTTIIKGLHDLRKASQSWPLSLISSSTNKDINTYFTGRYVNINITHEGTYIHLKIFKQFTYNVKYTSIHCHSLCLEGTECSCCYHLLRKGSTCLQLFHLTIRM